MIEHLKDIIIKHSLSTKDEICGLVVQDMDLSVLYVKCENTSHYPETSFVISPQEYSDIEDMYLRILAVVHSHPNGPHNFSDPDIEEIHKGVLPWILVSDKQFFFKYPTNYKCLLGRQFSIPKHDCYALACDYYKIYHDIILDASILRENDFWWKGSANSIIEDNYLEQGFTIVDSISDIQVGDAIFLAIRTPVPSHIMIYIGDGQVIHHARGRLSEIELYNGAYQKHTKLIVRHNANNY